MAGSLQSDWTDTATLTPVDEWANEIIQEGLNNSVIFPLTWNKRSNKKTKFFMSTITSTPSTWATGVTDAHTASETQLDYDTMFIDPVEYRTIMPVAYETTDEVDVINLEADIRKQLAYQAQEQFTFRVYTAFDDAALDGAYDWQVAGNALVYCDANTAVDYDAALTIDNFKEGVETLIAAKYPPTDCVLPPALYMDLFSESQFMNAAQYGKQNTAIVEGKIPRFMGVDFHCDLNMPDDNADADVGFLFNKNFYMGTVVSKTAQIKVFDRWNTGEWDFCLNVKIGAKHLRESAAVAFYT